MHQSIISFPVAIFPDAAALDTADRELLLAAREATAHAYAPYSKFKVGASVRLENGVVLTGTNQENAAFPAGICAERVALSAASASFPEMGVTALALSYDNETGASNEPISPCGICRQTLAEYEQRFGLFIRLVLGGNSGEVYVLQRATDLLPLAFRLK